MPGRDQTRHRKRLDAVLVERGLFPSRAQAAASILAGEVSIGDDPRRADKAGQLVDANVPVQVEAGARYASRGGVKLANAVTAFGGVDIDGRRCLDVGASTGGFTDYLLEHGAGHVVALDVAYGALAWRLRQSPRVTVIERVNARTLDCAILPYRPGLIVVDVSFISLSKVLPAVLACADDDFDCLALVKPQFEVGRERVGKGGVVRSAEDRRRALVDAGTFAEEQGWSVLGFASSGLPGPAGNRETFVWVRPGGDPRSVGDIREAAAVVEP